MPIMIGQIAHVGSLLEAIKRGAKYHHLSAMRRRALSSSQQLLISARYAVSQVAAGGDTSSRNASRQYYGIRTI